jgi:hypothetical protein
MQGGASCRGSWDDCLSRRLPCRWCQAAVLEKGKLGLACWLPMLGLHGRNLSLAFVILGI